jgi:hypothetical protein
LLLLLFHLKKKSHKYQIIFVALFIEYPFFSTLFFNSVSFCLLYFSKIIWSRKVWENILKGVWFSVNKKLLFWNLNYGHFYILKTIGTQKNSYFCLFLLTNTCIKLLLLSKMLRSSTINRWKDRHCSIRKHGVPKLRLHFFLP